MKKVDIKIGKSLRKKSAGEVKTFLKKRYFSEDYRKLVEAKKAPAVTEKDIEDCISNYFGEDEGAKKLGTNVNVSSSKSSDTTPKKKG